ncbi:hypothetical protein [Donghicola sp. XS_ASV15]|uniref:hypothetical protein n=1 Tax=Donghicola sp. XS_ASV15 TaxID=3241295 RepID=UPI003516BDC0
MGSDQKNSQVVSQALVDSISIFISALHHDVSASLRHANGFASLLLEESQQDPTAAAEWSAKIIESSQRGQDLLGMLTTCMRRALEYNKPEALGDLQNLVKPLELLSRVEFSSNGPAYTDPKKLSELYVALDRSLQLVSSDPQTCVIETRHLSETGGIQIFGRTQTQQVRRSNVDRFFQPLKFDQGDRTQMRPPLAFKIKITAAVLHGDAIAEIDQDGDLLVSVFIPDTPL